jgi:carboxypeptidase family protein
MLSRCALLLSLLALPTVAFAQANATVSGTVTDESKAVLPGVTVTATEITTGRQFVGVTDERGEYRFVNVSPGTYKIRAELTGFATVTTPNLELLVGQNALVPFALKVATLQETVTVTGLSPLVDTSSSQVAGNIDRRQMEDIPLAGRNWMELALMVKGVTANNVDQRPGVERDSQFQLNLDGQQITQKVASSTFGQPKFSREAIAEFQIITNMFDITQGRSTGAQVQAISRSGTNSLKGSFYGNFRDDKFNATDPVANRVLPYQNEQVGGTLGGPVVKDKLLFFTSYEYEREPQTQFAQPAQLPGQSFTYANTVVNHSMLSRVDQNLSTKDNLSHRVSFWNFASPFEVTSTSHPSNASGRTRRAVNYQTSWARVISDNKVQELRGGYNHYDWQNLVAAEKMLNTPNYVFPGITFGGPRNFPQHPGQNLGSARYDLNWHKETHDLKIGGEFLYWRDTGFWHILRRGEFIMTANLTAADYARRFPDPLDPATWNVTGLDSLVQRFNQNTGDWTIDCPRPTWGIWIGDNWRLNSRLTINYGVRWDDDLGATAAPDVGTQNTTTFAPYGGQLFQPSHDHNNVAPRAGFAWNVTGSGDLVIRGGSGIFYTTPVTNVTLSPQSFGNHLKVNTFLNDGRSGFIANPTRNFTAEQIANGASPQLPRAIAWGYEMPFGWQSTIGFQKQLSAVMGVDADLTHLHEYNIERGRDINLLYNPATGYNLDPAVFGRPDGRWDEIQWIESTGMSKATLLSSSLTRRFQKNFQGGVTYTLTFDRQDNTSGFGLGANNQFNLDDELGPSVDFQRHTARANAILNLPWDVTIAGTYLYGSGSRTQTTISGRPYNKPGTNRLNTGGPITIPVTSALGFDVLDRYTGPAVVATNAIVPVNALRGFPIHKVDFRVTKRIKLGGTARLEGVAEVFNLLNHANYGSYNGQVNSTTFGDPRQNLGNAYVPRTGQLAFRFTF